MHAPHDPLRVLHLPTTVGGNAGHLCAGERELGLHSELLTTGLDNPFGYQQGVSLGLRAGSPAIVKFAQLSRGFVQVRKRYDVFHFNYGTSLLHAPRFGLNLAELPFYPRDARLFVTYNGCDARQKFPTMQRRRWAACHDAACYGGQCNSGRLDAQRRAAIDKMESHAHHIWAVNPDLLRFLPPHKSSFLPYAISVGDLAPVPPRQHGPLRIAHAPTDRAAKGTQHIIDACQALMDRYPGQCTLDLIENLPRALALSRLADCDVLVDQLLIGWYGGVAIEAMLLGKAVVVRIEEDDLSYVPEPMRGTLPDAFLQADPDSLFAVLEQCVQERQRVLHAAQHGHAYARRWHDPLAVAGITAAAYRQSFAG